MASGPVTGARPREDLTAQARIRDAAMAHFAAHGFERATIRGIAEAAGVSPGLVQHHFGTKERLRQACDGFAIEAFRRQLRLVEHLDDAVSRPDLADALYASSPVLVRYLIRLLADGAPAGSLVFDETAAGTERFLSGIDPERFPPGSTRVRDGATLLVAMKLAAAVLHEQVGRRTGADPFDPRSAPRLGLVMLDVCTAMARWAASDTGVQTRSAVEHYLDDPAPPTAGPAKDDDDD